MVSRGAVFHAVLLRHISVFLSIPNTTSPPPCTYLPPQHQKKQTPTPFQLNRAAEAADVSHTRPAPPSCKNLRPRTQTKTHRRALKRCTIKSNRRQMDTQQGKNHHYHRTHKTPQYTCNANLQLPTRITTPRAHSSTAHSEPVKVHCGPPPARHACCRAPCVEKDAQHHGLIPPWRASLKQSTCFLCFER